MPVLRLSTRLMLSIALALVVLGAMWLTAAPEALPVSTYVSAAAMLTLLTAITIKTGMSDRGAGSLATPLHRTSGASRTAAAAHRPNQGRPRSGR